MYNSCGDKMRLFELDLEKVKQQAKIDFVDKYSEIVNSDWYLDDIFEGQISLDGLDEILYVNTNYVYHDVDVNGNKTRYKMPLTCLLVKNNPYEIIYSYENAYYVAYEDEGKINFILYRDFINFIKAYYHQIA